MHSGRFEKKVSVRTNFQNSADSNSSQPQTRAGKCSRGNPREISLELLEALAHAVAADDRAMLLGPDNSKVGECSISEAVRTRRPFFVRLAKDIFAPDADTAQASRYLVTKLRPIILAKGILPVIIRSGGKNRRHLFARVADSELRRELSTLSKYNGCDVRKFIRPPLSPHRRDLPVSLVEPDSPDEALERLQSPAREIHGRSGGSRVLFYPRPLPDAMQQLLRTRHSPAREYRSRSEEHFAFIMSAVNRGFPESWIFSQLFDPENAAGAKIREIAAQRGDPAAHKYLEGEIKRARARVSANPPFCDRSNALAALDAIEAAADSEQCAKRWHGRGGATDRAVFDKFIEIGRRVGAQEVGASLRELAILAGLASIETVARSLRRLRATGFLRLIDRPKPKRGLPGRFRIGMLGGYSPRHSEPTSGGCVEECLSEGLSRLVADTFRWNALGQTAWLIWRATRVSGREKEIADRLAMKSKGVRRQMRRLAGLGLVKRDEAGRWHRVIDSSVLASAAEELGTLSETQRQMARFEDERAMWRLRRSSRGCRLVVVNDDPGIDSTSQSPKSSNDSSSGAV